MAGQVGQSQPDRLRSVRESAVTASGSASTRLATSREQCETYCDDNRYVTTIHLISSCVLKLSKLSKATTVYRGLSERVIPVCAPASKPGLLASAASNPHVWLRVLLCCGGLQPRTSGF